MAKYEIPEQNLEALKNAVAKLNRKAERMGLPEIQLAVVDSAMVEEKDETTGVTTAIKYYVVELEGSFPRYEGWEFLASVRPAGGANLVLKRSGVEVDLSQYRTGEMTCDHCQTTRERNATFLIRNEAGEIRQVGSGCLSKYVGYKDLERVAKWFEQVYDFIETAEQTYGGRGTERLHYRTVEYLAAVSCAIREHGWLSRTKWQESDHLLSPTSHVAWTYLVVPEWHKSIEPQDKQLAEQVIAWAAAKLAEGIDGSDYLWNLCHALQDEYLGERVDGLVASAIAAFRREQGCWPNGDPMVPAEEKPVSQHLGTVGERMMFRNLRCVTIREMEGAYGRFWLTKLEDADGNRLVWFASRALEEGQLYSGKATVKAHNEWKGVAETQITRFSPK
jgi:hypothetical protein